MVRPKTDCYPISLEIGPTFLVYFKGLLIAYTSPVLFSNNDRALLRTWPMAICSRCTCHDHIHVLGHNDIALMKNGNTITTIWIISLSFFLCNSDWSCMWPSKLLFSSPEPTEKKFDFQMEGWTPYKAPCAILGHFFAILENTIMVKKGHLIVCRCTHERKNELQTPGHGETLDLSTNVLYFLIWPKWLLD